ncbi:leucyl aminopeptidase [Vampirovibrio chlorellavorus]|uniref:leucyl aminopeptidase n=1 Tax=Vampirovibrio chlorellavorus TaxID=758823 RepID=UPI0026ED58A0|nr:leucyl aminopeptidase [Vampirovibrio chlorellavorus]
MRFEAITGQVAQFSGEVLVLGITQGSPALEDTVQVVDAALGQYISGCLNAETSVFKAKPGETLTLPTYGKLPAAHVVLVGLGKVEELKSNQWRRAVAAAVRACKKLKAKTLGMGLPEPVIRALGPEAACRLLAEGALLGQYDFHLRKTLSKAGEDNGESAANGVTDLDVLTVVEPQADRLEAIQRGLRVGQVVAEHTNLARHWVNDSANYVTPTFLRQQAEGIPGLQCEVLDFDAIKALGMGAFQLVAQGSEQPPYLIHLCYKPSGTPSRKVALVGKGITFDSGGLSLKPAASMELMKMDMAGAAAVLATLKAVSALKDLNIEVHGFIPTCENMPSGVSSKPGDIVTAMNGKTIEVNNTDAEGRLILCDALTYAQRQVDPDELVDIATLTGACVTALGKVAAGIMGTSDPLIERLRVAGEQAGEKLWQLPLYDEYKAFLKSDVADLINSGAKGQAGSSAGGMFLKEFVDKKRAWAHLDIAGPAWATSDTPEVPKGGTGFGVRTLLYYLYGWQA